jgi:polar amino acid transport system substrate-binding protein
MAKATLVKFKDQTALLSQLLSGGVEAIVLGAGSTEEYVARYPLRVALQRDLTQGTAFPFRKEATRNCSRTSTR